MNSAKAVIYIGALRIEYDTPADPHDYQVLIEKTWQVSKLNLAATMEGWNPEDCLPFSETGAPGKDGKRHKYCGLVHMPTGEKIRFGQQTGGAGGHWYVRSKSDAHYRGPESFLKPEDFAGAALYQGEQPRQLPAGPPPQRPQQQPVQAVLDDGSPANEKQKEALNKMTTRVLNYDDWSYSDQTNLFDSFGFKGLNMLSESDAGKLIQALNQRLAKK